MQPPDFFVPLRNYDSIHQKNTPQRADRRGQPRPGVETRRREYPLPGRRAQRKPRTHGIRPPVRTPDVPRNARRGEFRPSGADGFGRQQRLHQQRLHGFLHHAPEGQPRNGPLARKRPHGGTRHHPRQARSREEGGDRGVPPAIPQPALRRPDDAAAGARLQGPPLPLGGHRPRDRPYRRSHARGRRVLLPHPLPPVERHSVDLGRHGGEADAGAGRKVVRAARRPPVRDGRHPAGTRADTGPPPGGRTRRAGLDRHRSLSHVRAHQARFLHRRPGFGPALGRRLGTPLHAPRQRTQPAVERQRLHHGRRRSGTVRLHGPAAPGRDARSGRSGFPRRDRSPANDRRDRIRNRKGQEQIRSQHALRRTERDEQGDEPRVLRDAGRPLPDQPRGGPLPRRHRRGHPLFSRRTLRPENSSTLIYNARK